MLSRISSTRLLTISPSSIEASVPLYISIIRSYSSEEYSSSSQRSAAAGEGAQLVMLGHLCLRSFSVNSGVVSWCRAGAYRRGALLRERGGLGSPRRVMGERCPRARPDEGAAGAEREPLNVDMAGN